MFDIELAGIVFRIENMYSEVETMCRDYYAGVVSKNETEQYTDMQCNRRIKVTESDIKLERMKSESEDRKEGIQVRHFSDAYLETLAVYRKIAEQMIDYNTILFHGSVIAVDGEGYLFTAKSGTGKSTHTRLWREYFGDRAVMVNDDKPLLKITEEGVTAFGTPWDGKHRLSNNIAVPLKAICVLNRDETNHIVMINDIRFKGKRTVNWKDVREYLKEYVGDFYKIAATGDIVYIGSDLPKEYTGSKYTNSLKGANAKAKANAAQGIPELIEIAVGKYYKKNNEDKHKRDAKNGWYRYDSRFAIPVYDDKNEITRYNVFHASMLIRHSNDNKLYLYDILDIKKETSNSFSI